MHCHRTQRASCRRPVLRQAVRGFAGATELGDQRVGLVLDTPALVDEVLSTTSDIAAKSLLDVRSSSSASNTKEVS